MRYLGVDYGTKRIGIAISDENGEFAFPREIITPGKTAIEYIKKLVSEEKIEGIVLGQSLATNEMPNVVSGDIENFKKELEQIAQVSLEREGHSSVEAYRYQQTKGPADDRAAAIILQRFLDKNRK